MNEIKLDQTQARLLSIGAFAVTIFMISGGVTDPVNAPKFFLLGSFGFGCALLLILKQLRPLWSNQRSIFLAVICFLIASLISLSMSKAALTQSLYGSYGRNNGFIAYLSLAFILLAATTLQSKRSYSWILYSLLVSGVVNVAYCSWVILFGDFMGWNNEYNNLLGTFGNPNFIGSFLSIFATASLAFIIQGQVNIKIRVFLGIAIVVAIIEMLKTNVMQGKVVLGLGILLVIGAAIRSKSSNVILTWAYFAIVGVVGVTAILGILQKGPLAKYIYQYTVSLRGQYWRAGLKAGQEHIIGGVGFDSFGDWYRRTRSAQALITPGVDVTTNTAHNVVIDMFAFGGLPLLLAYLTIIFLTIKSILKHFISKKKFDPLFVSLSVAWIGYQAQSLISINQLGLAIWGWLLSGAIIGYVGLDSKIGELKNKELPRKMRTKTTESPITPGLIAGLGILLGGIVSVPPLSADMNLRSAQITRSAEKLEQALEPTYLHPQNTNMYLNSLISLEQAGLNDSALKIAKKALKFNPNSFETWRALYFLKSASESDKQAAYSNMKRLDPLNKNFMDAPK